MSPEATCRRATQFGFTLLGNEFALDAKSHSIEQLSATRKSMRWVRGGESALIVDSPGRIADYISLLANREYSYLMNDGGLIQLAYIFERNEIDRHRLVYCPCPFAFTIRELNSYNGALLDLINDQFMPEIEETVLLRSPIRFDYAPTDAADYHPASHLTINAPSCRIPARAPLQFYTFLKFILENFYLEAWQSGAVKAELTFSNENDCLSEQDRSRAYLHWTHR